MLRHVGVVAALLAAGSIVACGGEDDPKSPGSELTENGVRLGADGMPVDANGNPLATRLDGQYELASEVDLTTVGLLPETVGDTLKALSNFKEKPSQTLVDLMDVANVPVVPAVLDAIPGPIRGFVLGYIDDHVFKALYDAVPVTKRLTSLLDDLASIITRFDVVTTLDLPPGDGIGNARAKHSLAGIGWSWDGKPHVVRAPAAVGTIAQQSVDANAVALEKRSPQLESGRLKVGDHTFSIPLGTYAVLGADELAKVKFGADLRGALGKVVDCGKLAEDVANRCIDPFGPGKVCVGHQKEIDQICTKGLDVLVDSIKASIRKLDIPVFALEEGVAQMWDAPVEAGPLDARIDRIEGGFWTAKIKITKEDRPFVATFSGKRVGESSAASSPTK